MIWHIKLNDHTYLQGTGGGEAVLLDGGRGDAQQAGCLTRVGCQHPVVAVLFGGCVPAPKVSTGRKVSVVAGVDGGRGAR